MSGQWTVAEIARYDQALADTDAELDALVRAMQIGTRERGPRQAMANIAVLLVARHDKTDLVGLLSAALRRISAETTEGEQ